MAATQVAVHRAEDGWEAVREERKRDQRVPTRGKGVTRIVPVWANIPNEWHPMPKDE